MSAANPAPQPLKPRQNHPTPQPPPPKQPALEDALAQLNSDSEPTHLSSVSSSSILRSSTSDSLSSAASDPPRARRSARRQVDRRSEGKMRAAYVLRHGPAALVFRFGWVDRPLREHLRPGTALVRIHAASVNAADCRLRSGTLRHLLPLPFPSVLGTDFAGVLHHLCPPAPALPHLSPLRPGDRVYGQADLHHGFGSYAEWAVVRVQRVARMPSKVSFAQAAALPTISLTAHAALAHYASLRDGERVLVFGGTSGVGHAAIQLARALGAAEVATTCSQRNAAFVAKLGATKSFDYHAKSAAEVVRESCPDVVLDTSGSPAHWAAVQAMAPNARFVVASGSECLGPLACAAGVGYLDVLDFVAKAAGRKALSRMKIGPGYDLVMPSALDAPLSTITPFVEMGQLEASIFKEFSLCNVAKAHDLRENKRPRGKVVINIAKGAPH